MNFEKLYENIILRDILEYFTPGAIFICGVCLIFESLINDLAVKASLFLPIKDKPLNTSLFLVIQENPLLIIFLSLLGYASGHFLTAINKKWFREKTLFKKLNFFQKKEDENPFSNLTKDDFVKNHLLDAIFASMKIAETNFDTVKKSLNDSESFKFIREIGRTVIQEKRPSAYREFVVRHSILSRFCENMVIALSFLLFSVYLFSYYRIPGFWNIAKDNAFVVIILTAIVLIAIYFFKYRIAELRKNMVRHTFIIWYADTLMPEKKEKSSEKTAD